MNLKFLYKAFKEGRIKKISDRMFEVDDKVVSIQTKKGRKLMTCSCVHHTKWCNSPVFCWHKNLVIVYPIFEYYTKKIKEKLDFLKTSKQMNNELNTEEVIVFLENLGEFK